MEVARAIEPIAHRKAPLLSNVGDEERTIGRSKVSFTLKDERGSISILVGGLFLITVSLLIAITSVAEVAIAKRSLTQATESAAQRGVRNLDHKAYYQGEFDEITMVSNLFGAGPNDPGIPIDCQSARGDVSQALRDWVNGDQSLTRVELSDLQIQDIRCDGFGLQVTVKARVTLPITLPFLDLKTVAIESTVGTTNTREEGLYLFGFRIL